MKAIFKREIKSYFSAPLGYIFLAVFYLISGFFFYKYNVEGHSTDMRSLFSNLYNFGIFLVPVLTMRLMSEDKKQKTDQALLTAPISLLELVMGKYLSALVLYLMATSITLVYAFFMAIFSPVDWPVIVGCYIGINIAGAALIAIGMFISTLTESQMIAAIVSLVTMLFFAVYDTVVNLIGITFIKEALLRASFVQNFATYSIGVVNLGSTVFFLSVIGLFIFLTIRVIDKRRWA